MAESCLGADKIALCLEQQTLNVCQRYLPSCDVWILGVIRDVVADSSIQVVDIVQHDIGSQGFGAELLQEPVSQNAKSCSAVGAVIPGRGDYLV